MRAGDERRCPVTIAGRADARDGLLQCLMTARHLAPHKFMAPDASLGWWPIDLGDPPAWEDAIATPATDPRWPSAPRESEEGQP